MNRVRTAWGAAPEPKGRNVEFVSRSEIVVPIAEMHALDQAFRERAHLVDRHVGYRRLELLRGIREDGRYVLLTRWRSQEDFRAYMKSGDHQRSHERAHAGLGPVNGGGKLEQLWLTRVLAVAAEMRRARTAVLPEAMFIACEISCREAARDVPVRRGAGQLLASAVADRALDFGAHDEALLQVMCNAVGSNVISNVVWQRACVAAHARALAALEISASGAP